MHSFCRKATLTKHQHRSHHRLSVTQTPSENINSEVSYLGPVATPDPPNNPGHLTQLPCYSSITAVTNNWGNIQNLAMTSIAGWAQASAVSCHDPVNPFLKQYAEQEGHLQFIQQQQSGRHYTGCFPVEYQRPYAQLAIEDNLYQ